MRKSCNFTPISLSSNVIFCTFGLSKGSFESPAVSTTSFQHNSSTPNHFSSPGYLSKGPRMSLLHEDFLNPSASFPNQMSSRVLSPFPSSLLPSLSFLSPFYLRLFVIFLSSFVMAWDILSML